MLLHGGQQGAAAAAVTRHVVADQDLDRRRRAGAEVWKETDHTVELVERGPRTVGQLAQGGDGHEAVRVLDLPQGCDDRGTAAHSFGDVSVAPSIDGSERDFGTIRNAGIGVKVRTA